MIYQDLGKVKFTVQNMFTLECWFLDYWISFIAEPGEIGVASN